MVTPFKQGAFSDLPERPRLAHVYDDAESRMLTLRAPDWPEMQVHVKVFGTGPPLLLIHGLMTSAYSWRYAFAGLGEHFTCYAPDLPGAGLTDTAPSASFGPHALARWLDALTKHDALNIRGCPVIGNSMGGYLAMVLALLQPNAMGRLVNLHSPGIPELRLAALGAVMAAPGSRWLLRRLVQRDSLRWAHRNVHYYDESLKSLEEARHYGAGFADDERVDALHKYLSQTMALAPMKSFQAELLSRRDAVQSFPKPLLLVYADEDPMVPPRFGAEFARLIPSARLVWMSEASHFAHVDATDRFVDIVLPFLKGAEL